MTVDLVPEWTIGDVRLTSYPFGVAADSTVDIGEPEMVVETVTSMLTDGDLERVVRHGNRTYSLDIYIEGPTLGELAENEAALRAELRRPSLSLTHDPGDGFSPASVYEVQTAQLTPQRQDDHESHLIRKFTLTLRCAPWAMSAEMVTVAALPVHDTALVIIDDCSTTTAWTATRSGASTPVAADFWDPGSVGVGELSAEVEAPERWTMTRSGSVDFTGSPYLVVQARTTAVSPNLLAYADASASGTPLPLLAVRLLPDSQVHEYTFLAGAVVAGSLSFAHTSPAGSPWQVLVIHEVARTGEPPGETLRQQTRIIETVGTERTPASIHVADPLRSTATGLTIVHTSPEDGSGYSPPLRRWRVSGNTVDEPRPDALSGAIEPLNPDQFVAQVPTPALPMGGYVLMARLACSDPVDVPINWSVSTIPHEGGDVTEVIAGTRVWKFPAPATEFSMVPLAILTLPTLRTNQGWVEVRLHREPAGPAVNLVLDEAFLFRMGDDCALTVVDNNYSEMWLDSPDAERLVSTLWVGLGDTRFHPPGVMVTEMGNHMLHPQGTAIFTATEKVDNPETDATFYPRWHSNAAL